MLRIPVSILIFLGYLIPVCAQDPAEEILITISDRKEAYVSINTGDIKKLYDPFSLPGYDRILSNRIYLYLTSEDSIFIRRNSDKLRLEHPPSMIQAVSMSDNPSEILNAEAYPTYPAYLEIMQYFHDSFPDICSIDTIGLTVDGRLILSARITRNGNEKGNVPVAFFSSSIHGDETAGYSFMLLLINEILNSDKPDIRELRENAIIIINPLENPDGTYFESDTTLFGSTRSNANGVNLNRNYPDPQDGENPDGNTRQPETYAMMQYLSGLQPVLSANFHGGAEVVNYPFDTWPDLHADDAWFRFISLEYASLASSILPGYMNSFDNGITNGYEWYEVNGGRQDWVTYFLHGRETTIELSRVKTLSESDLSTYWQANKQSMVNFMRQALYGIHGRVYDSLTGENLKAEIYLPGHDRLNSRVFSDSLSGRFFRPVKAGGYSMRASSSGYRPKEITGIITGDYNTTSLNIALIPDYVLPDQISIKCGPNPFREEISIYIESPVAGYAQFRLYDLYGNMRYETFHYCPAGYNDYSLTPSLAAGFYYLEVRYQSNTYTFRIVKTE